MEAHTALCVRPSLLLLLPLQHSGESEHKEMDRFRASRGLSITKRTPHPAETLGGGPEQGRPRRENQVDPPPTRRAS
ncbi:hypothetical protein MRX96_012148 [Rhipicephalus microplus]